MNKTTKTILISSAVFLGGVFSGSVPAYAVISEDPPDLVVEFEQDPLFSESNFLPGSEVVRWVKITNNSSEAQSIAAEAINFPGFPDINGVPPDDLSRALKMEIRKGGADLFSGTLFDFYGSGEKYLSDVLPGETVVYDFKVSFPAEETDYQGKTTGFDIIVGSQGGAGEGGGTGEGGEGGGTGEGGGNGGGAVILPPGLTIKAESVKTAAATTTAVITWTTSYPSTSYVIYSSSNEPRVLDLSDNGGTPPKYGYAHATPEIDTDPKAINHSVTIYGLTPGETYYFRAVSHASLAISRQYSFTTLTEADFPLSGGGKEVGLGKITPVNPATSPTTGIREAGGGGSAGGAEDGTGTANRPAGGIEAPAPGGESGTGEKTAAAFGNKMFLAALGEMPFNFKAVIVILLAVFALLFILFLSRRKRKSADGE